MNSKCKVCIDVSMPSSGSFACRENSQRITGASMSFLEGGGGRTFHEALMHRRLEFASTISVTARADLYSYLGNGWRDCRGAAQIKSSQEEVESTMAPLLLALTLS
ncbi:hypothetical protein KM043_012762 [Ampulex compressa]|nr:hypothetical protein KM043_012762 [Ampulex compressa]